MMRFYAVLWLLLSLLGCEPKAAKTPAQPADLVKINSPPEQIHSSDEGHHNHGVASLNLVLDGGALSLQVQIAAQDAVGFEQPPQSDTQKAALTQVLTSLKRPDELFSVAKNADCTLTQGEVTTALLNAASKTIEHADFVAHYQWHCAQPQALKTLQIHLFGQFPHLQKINSQYVVNTKQGARILTPSDNQLVFE